ncbi:SusD/RagB family nutrient-binding outer membrane lipoprotein [Parabacteroides sp. OttesenSCG-928-K15]|nr:SusD/RagB family nutrient-binding outer membrane lipoprotein [Parabacteroides sp. OttesenSCG-928-K15]
MKRINKYLTLFLSFIFLIGCDNFEDINTNPDSPTTVPASMIATYLIRETVKKDRYVKEYSEDNVLTKHIVWNEGVSDLQYNLIGRKSFEPLLLVANCNNMITLAEGNKGYEGLAYFVKAYAIYYVSMQLGDIPYSEVGKGEEGILKPTYDTQKEVLLGVLKDLEESYKCFSAANERAFEGDIIYDGDREKWKKTVTAFQLKVLINLSKKANDSDLNLISRFATIVQNGSLMTSNDDNFQLTYRDQSGMKYPFNDLTSNQTKYAIHSSVLVDQLKKMNDYRLFYYAEPARGKTAVGFSASDYDAYIGVDPTIPYGEITQAMGTEMFCTLNLRYTSIEHPEGEPLIRLGYGEQQMILAEACLRGWISGDAAAYYAKGIEANMRFTRDVTPDIYCHERKMTDDYIASYIASDAVKLTGNFEADLEKIIWQKYIASFLQYTFEAYFDYRRTGYPVLPVNPQTSKNVAAPDKIPVRFMYSNDEYNFNRESLVDALQRQYNGNDGINEVMWIIK